MDNQRISLKSVFINNYAELLSLFVFIFYLFTLGRSIGEFDSGELALSQATLSIPHPTGYPLFILVGFLFSHIPIPVSTLIKLNLLNAIWCSLTVFILMKSLSLILNNLSLFLNERLKTQLSDLNPILLKVVIPSSFGGLMLAFSATFWLQSTKVEVYSLQIFIASVILYNSLKVYLKYENGLLNSYSSVRDILKTWLLIAVLLGFGFSNHMMTVYLLPATIFIFFSLNGVNKNSIISFFILLLISFIITALFYTGLMFRAASSPPWAHGDPSNLSRLIDHITAREYSKHMFQGTENLYKQGSQLLKMLSFNLSFDTLSFGEFAFSLFLGIAGLLLLLLFKRKILIYLYLLAAVSVIFALSYNIPDINEYFLVVFFIISLSAGIMVNFLIMIFHNKKYVIPFLIVMLFLFILVQVFVNYKYADRSEFYVIEDFLKSSLEPLPKNSVILSDNWESVLSPALYYRDYEKFRYDISIISPSRIILFDWYRNKNKFKIFDGNLVITPRENLIATFDVGYDIIRKGIIKLPEHFSLVPMRNFYLIGVDTLYYPLIKSDREIRFSKYITSPSEEYIKVLIPTLLEQRIYYELTFNKILNAKQIFDQIKNEFPEHKFSDITLAALYKHNILN